MEPEKKNCKFRASLPDSITNNNYMDVKNNSRLSIFQASYLLVAP